MTEFTLADLVGAMRKAAGENEETSLDSDIVNMEFTALGYDSLAMMETVSVIERQHGLSLPEDLVATETPKAFVDAVNAHLTQHA
jgi:act minimal PKS acyl carrier protein